MVHTELHRGLLDLSVTSDLTTIYLCPGIAMPIFLPHAFLKTNTVVLTDGEPTNPKGHMASHAMATDGRRVTEWNRIY